MFRAGRGDPHIHPTGLRSEVVVVRPDGSIVRPLGPGSPVRFLASGELVVEDPASFPVRVEAVSIDAGARRLLFRVPSRVFDLSADGRRIAYQQYEKDGTAVLVRDAASEPRRLTEGDLPALSPDGALVAFGRRRPDGLKGKSAHPWESALYVARVADGAVRRYELPAGAPEGMGAIGRWWAWSPDGRRLALTLEEPP